MYNVGPNVLQEESIRLLKIKESKERRGETNVEIYVDHIFGLNSLFQCVHDHGK